MVRLEVSKTLHRKIRQDPLTELMIPTWTRAEDAIRAGRIEQGLELMEYGHFEDKQLHDALARLVAWSVDCLAEGFGEDRIEELWRRLRAKQGNSI